MAKTIKQQIADQKAIIEKATTKIAELEPQLAAEIDYESVQAGRTVTFNYGKGNDKRVLTGLVLGRKNAEPGAKGGDFVKIAVGEGFDAFIAIVNPGAVTKIEPAAEEVAAA